MSVAAPKINKHAVADSFSRAAHTYDAAAGLQRDVFQLMCEHFALPDVADAILDVGCGTAKITESIGRRYPNAKIVGLDIAEGMLRFAQRHHANITFVCADAEVLPFADGQFDLIVSNFAVQWCTDFYELFAEIRRCLAPGGRFVFSIPAENTLIELKESWYKVDPGFTHVNQFPALEYVRSAAQAADCSRVELEQSMCIVKYDSLRELMAELKAIGAHNVTEGRAKSLTGKSTFAGLISAYEQFRDCDGKLPATWQIMYGMLIK